MKYFKYLLVLFLGIVLLPNMVYAQELAKEGVTYFMIYPNNEEYVTEDYNEAISPEEKLIFSGVTNENGEIILTGWQDKGQLRVVQHVPNGYSTDAEEIIVDLSAKKTEFINYKKLLNPKTGKSIIVIITLIVVIIGTILLISTKQKKKIMLLLIPLLLVSLTFSVKATNNNFIITVRDKAGNKMANVQVEVYAKPTKVEGTPAIKYVANGGTFLDGTDIIYIKLPKSELSMNEFYDYLNSLPEEQLNELFLNMNGVIRENYEPNYRVGGMPETLKNGTEIKIIWNPISDENKIITIKGNGGSFKFKNKIITEIKVYSDNILYIEKVLDMFKNNDNYLIGEDNNSSCDNYQSNGLPKNKESNYYDIFDEIPETMYLCWNKKPDGIYVNDSLFLGNADSCYENSQSVYNEDYYLNLHNIKQSMLNFENINSEDIKIVYYKIVPQRKTNSNILIFNNIQDLNDSDNIINKLEIVSNGKVILTLTESDLNYNYDNNYNRYEHYFINASKRDQLIAYLKTINKNSCSS